MVSDPALLGRPFRNVQSTTSREQLRERNCVLLDVLKTLELELQRRGLVGSSLPAGTHDTTRESSGEVQAHFHPLWFLAETERNIFLWRNGCSLIEHDEFEFWVDVEALIDKRLKMLETFDSENPFLNPLWGALAPAPGGAEAEREYLEELRDLLCSIGKHASALCEVGSGLLKDICPVAANRPAVPLPLTRKSGKKNG